jgi:DNA-binding NtrC family response regulator
MSNLESLGLEASRAPQAGELSEFFGERSPAVAVVCCSKGDGEVRRVLDFFNQRFRGAPVVALVERSDFSQYYRLMRDGVSYYFEMSERPEVIATAIRRASAC